MKAFKYKIQVCESAIALSHGWMKLNIIEIYIPEYSIYFNSKGFIFRENIERFKMGEDIETIEINHEVAEKLKDFIDKKILIETIMSKFFQQDS